MSCLNDFNGFNGFNGFNDLNDLNALTKSPCALYRAPYALVIDL
ncbi:MAG: hypothetical protein P8075_08320 [Deltaproteobacteria bacterium]|jgi:hypothetical protein